MTRVTARIARGLDEKWHVHFYEGRDYKPQPNFSSSGKALAHAVENLKVTHVFAGARAREATPVSRLIK